MINTNNLPSPFNNDKTKENLTKICEQNDVALLAVFGSFARGEQKTKSDIDLAIEFTKNSRKTLLDLVGLQFQLKRIFKRKVDLGTLKSINPHVAASVKKDLKIIYAKR